MKRFTKTLFIVLVAVAFVATGCKKESEYKTVTLGAKIAANNSKVYINDVTPIWQTGDQVRVNGTDASHTITVSQISGNTAKLENVPQSDDGYYAIYPAEYATAFSNGQFAVTLPAHQEYTEVGGHQVVKAPMGAKTDGGSLTFHNLCSLLKVTVTAGETLKIREIKVTAGTTNLSGSTSITLSGEATDALPAPATGSKSVTLSFGNTGKELTSGSYDFYIYLPAFTSQDVSVEVYNIGANNILGVKKKTFNGISVSANTINTVGTGSLTAASFTTTGVTTTGAISGLFSVSSTKQVRFSKGNLQYNSSNDGSWQFAEHQYDYVGAWNTSDWVDLFGWGTWTGNTPNPTKTSTTDSYPWNDADFTQTLTNATGTWRTLTNAEWAYLLNSRTTTSGVRYARATVNGVNGLIFLPDDWSTTYYTLNSTNAVNASYTTNTISSGDWTSSLVAHGAVFLPAAGMRSDTGVSNVGQNGYYWSSTDMSYSYGNYSFSGAGHMRFISGSNLGSSYSDDPYKGMSVRLVQEY